MNERNDTIAEKLERLRREIERAERERDRARQDRDRAQRDKDRVQRDKDRVRREKDRVERDNERMRRERDRLQADLDRMRRERERMERELERLRKALEAARREAKRQAAPFSKGAPRAHPRRPGRKAGRRHGRHGHRPIPARVDETHRAALPPSCPDCGGPVRRTRVATQYQEEIPAVRPIVRRFLVEVGCCTACRRRVQGRHPLQTSDALGAAAAQLGPQAVALAAVLNKQLGLPFGKVATLFRERFGLRVTPGGLVQALHRAARRAQPSYDNLCATIRGSPAVVPDETGWKVGGLLHWLWVFVASHTTVYAIQSGRGFEEAAAILGADFAGRLTRDGWAPYRQFVRAVHQSCVGHLQTRCRRLRADHPGAVLPARVQDILQRALGVRDRRDAGAISPHGATVAGGRLSSELLNVIERPSSLPAVERFAKHLATEFVAILNFLFDPALDATNWRAEQAIRPAVVTRKMCGGGNRTARGAQTQQVLASVLRTASQRGLDSSDLLVQMLRAPVPTVPHDLRAPAP